MRPYVYDAAYINAKIMGQEGPLWLGIWANEAPNASYAAAEKLCERLVKTLPGAKVSRNGSGVLVDPHLTDPGDQHSRDSLFLTLVASAASCGLDPRLLPLVRWITAPIGKTWPSVMEARRDRAVAEALSNARHRAFAPLLAPFLADPRRHGVSGSVEGFRLFHTELSPLERHIALKAAMSPPSSGRDTSFEHDPFPSAEVEAAIASMASSGWIVNMRDDCVGRSTICRGRLLRGLSGWRDLLDDGV